MKKSGKLLLCLVALLPFSMLHVKAEHTHTWSDWEVTCPATCDYEGVKVRYCTECYEEDAEDIPATGKHDWSKWYIEEPSCFTPGSKTRYCEYCNKEEEENIPARGYHTWGKWEILEKADCLNDGEKYRICTVCGKEETQKIPANKNSHNYGKWSTVRKSTAFKKGYAARTCITCSREQRKYLPLLSCAKIKTSTEKQISKNLNSFFSAAQIYSRSKMQKCLASGKVEFFSDTKTQVAWRKYTKLYLRFKIKSITVKGKKATVKLYCQYPDATLPYSDALTQANIYYYDHPNTSDEKMHSIFNTYIRKYLKRREIKTTTISLGLVKKGNTWKISKYTDALENVIHGNYSKAVGL